METHFPSSVIIVGAGVFGLSTALAIANRYPSTRVTVIDRQTPPVPDGTSVDTSHYIDEHYADLAEKAQDIIYNDVDLRPYYFEHGFSFVTDGQSSELDSLFNQMLESVKAKQPPSKWKELNSPEAVFQNLHGDAADLVPDQAIGNKRKWVRGYLSRRCATVNAEAMVKVYYDRARSISNVEFVLGTPVDRLWYEDERVNGVILEDGRVLLAERTILATGAWSSRLVNLEGILEANAVGIAYMKLTKEEFERYKSMGCHTNLTTGMNIFTPLNGLLKVLRRAGGIRNTTEMKDPDHPSKTYSASYPLTALDDPSQAMPSSLERGLRDELREIFPSIADRPFAKTKFCWLEQTTNSDFLICPHPRYSGLHMATGGSLHGWKFLPLLGEFVVDSISESLAPELTSKWSWESKLNAKQAPFGFMLSKTPVEFRDVLAGTELSSNEAVV